VERLVLMVSYSVTVTEGKGHPPSYSPHPRRDQRDAAKQMGVPTSVITHGGRAGI